MFSTPVRTVAAGRTTSPVTDRPVARGGSDRQRDAEDLREQAQARADSGESVESESELRLSPVDDSVEVRVEAQHGVDTA